MKKIFSLILFKVCILSVAGQQWVTGHIVDDTLAISFDLPYGFQAQKNDGSYTIVSQSAADMMLLLTDGIGLDMSDLDTSWEDNDDGVRRVSTTQALNDSITATHVEIVAELRILQGYLVTHALKSNRTVVVLMMTDKPQITDMMKQVSHNLATSIRNEIRKNSVTCQKFVDIIAEHRLKLVSTEKQTNVVVTYDFCSNGTFATVPHRILGYFLYEDGTKSPDLGYENNRCMIPPPPPPTPWT